MMDVKEIIDVLYTAVQLGRIEEVKILTSYLRKSSTWNPSCDLLRISLLLKHPEIARFFLNNNCEITRDRTNDNGNSVLHLAVLFGDYSLVKLMLNRGASRSWRNAYGLLPFHLVAYRTIYTSGSLLSQKEFDDETSKIIDVFLKFGENINAVVLSPHKNGFTSLHLAAEVGNEKIVRILLRKQSNINEISEAGLLSPLDLAMINFQIQIVKLLISEGATVHQKNKWGKTPPCCSIEDGKTDVIETRLNLEAPPRRKISKYIAMLEDEQTLLTAVEKNNLLTVESLLNRGAKVNISSEHGTTLLEVAIENRSEDMLQLLLERGADITAAGEHGKTSLYFAVEKQWEEGVEILLNRVPEIFSVVDFPAADGLRPIQLAIKNRCVEIALLFIERGHAF